MLLKEPCEQLVIQEMTNVKIFPCINKRLGCLSCKHPFHKESAGRVLAEFHIDKLTVISMLDALKVAQLELTAPTLKLGGHRHKIIAEIGNKLYKDIILNSHCDEKELYVNVIQNVQDHLSSRIEAEKDEVLKQQEFLNP